MITSGPSSLESLAQGKSDEEYGRMIAQAYTVLGHLSARHKEVLVHLRDSTNLKPLTRLPHDHPAHMPCLWCAMSPERMSSLEANLVELPLTHLGLDRESGFADREWATTRLRACAPSERYLSERFGPYWFDVLALPLELVHAHPESRAALLHGTGSRMLRVEDGDDLRHAVTWLAESTMRSMLRRRGGLPLGGSVSWERVLQLAQHLWERSKGSLSETGRIDSEISAHGLSPSALIAV